MRRPSLGLGPAALLVVACATSQSAPPQQVAVTPNTLRVETPNGVVEARTTAEDRAEVQTIKTPLEAAWSKLPAVYGELSLPVTTYVDQTRQIAAKNAHLRGHLGKIRLSQIITCGTDITGDDKANAYEVSLDVQTALSPAPDGQTNVQTMVTGQAKPMSTSGEPVRCVSTGSLEKRIANLVLMKTATP
jgi:hypothetical protein